MRPFSSDKSPKRRSRVHSLEPDDSLGPERLTKRFGEFLGFF